MRSILFKKTSQEKQKNQTTKTRKINYIQTLMSIFLKKFVTKEQQIETTNKIQLKLRENAVKAVKSDFSAENVFN